MPSNEPAANTETQPAARARSIPSLDGMRAYAVCAVILSHYIGWAVLPKSFVLRSAILVLGQGGLGVSAFFIISGFLITTLLLNEQDRTGGLDLKLFYFRRTLRIFPAFYVYLLVAVLVAFFAGHPIPKSALITSATYLSDYWPYSWIKPPMPSWPVGHTWSLSVEEQFYLLWPFVLVKMSRRGAIRTCLAVICLSPLLRCVSFLWLPMYSWFEQWYRLFHTNADVLAIGCLLAFAVREPGWLSRLERFLHPLVLIGCGAFLSMSAYLLVHEPQWVNATLVITATNICLALLILFFVLRPQTPLGRLLNWKPVRHVGVISYSLYLWQQLFLGPYNNPSRLRNVVAIFVCAELSFWLVERSFLKLRGVVERRWFAAVA
jgi:peptidoglycan/LPS O-acetylase OafA/YrhL